MGLHVSVDLFILKYIRFLCKTIVLELELAKCDFTFSQCDLHFPECF
jgi:hypothetical protein